MSGNRQKYPNFKARRARSFTPGTHVGAGAFNNRESSNTGRDPFD